MSYSCPEKIYIAIDLKSFYASVECVDRGLDPLTANLVVADPTRTDKTICLAVTPALKSYGLSGRSRLFEVVQKAKEVRAMTGQELEYIVAPPRMGRYVEVSSHIYDIYLKYVSDEDIHVYSIDEVFIDVTKYLKLYGMSARDLCMTMIRDVLSETGVTATAGIAPNLYLCKIAMDIVAKHMPADKDGVRLAELSVDSYRRTLWAHKPLTDFWMTGAGTAKRLARMGVYTMGDLARLSLTAEDQLYREFGINAELMIDHAWGIEPCGIGEIKSYRPQSSSLSSGQVLKEPYDYEKTRIIVREMTELLVLDMVEKKIAASVFTLDICYDRCSVDNGTYDGETVSDWYGRLVPAPAHGTANIGTPTSSTQRIQKAIMELFDSIVDPELFSRRINISAGKVVAEEYEQFTIFMDPEKQLREKNLQRVILDIQQRYGKNAVLKGTSLQEGATTMERNHQIGGHNA